MQRLLSYITIFFLAVVGQAALAADYYVGQTIKAKSTEGVEISYEITSLSPKTCRINSWGGVPTSTTGKVTIPYSVEGFTVVETGNWAFGGCKSITSIVFPSGLTRIGDGAFSGCESLTEVSLPSGLTEIGDFAFDDCKALKSFSCPSKVTRIGNWVFYGCESLTEVSLPNGLTEIGDYAFCRCKALKSFSCPSTLTRIGSDAFSHCEALESFSGGNSLKEIDSYAFFNCNALKTVIGISNLEYLGSSVFYGTPWYDSLPSGMIYLGKVAYKFKDTNTMAQDTKLAIKDGTTCISEGAFSSCSNLISVSIPKSVYSIGNNPFSYCTNLTSITVDAANNYYDSRDNCNAIIHTASNCLISGCGKTAIPSTVKSIGGSAFSGSSIISMSVPDNIDSLASYSFISCNSLKSLTIGKGVRKIGTNAFTNCSQLDDIVVSSSNPYFSSQNNCKGIIEKSTNTLVVGCLNTVIPSNVKTIGNSAFRTCSDGTFYTYTIPDNIESIESYAFEYDSSLRSITIGKGVKEIGNSAFYGCNNLLVIHSEIETPFEITETTFQDSYSNLRDNILNNAILYVPTGTRINYMSTPGWNKFKHIVESSGNGFEERDVFSDETVEGNKLYYTILSNKQNTCELIGAANNVSGQVTIPNRPKGYTVISLADRCFYDYYTKRDITSVTIPGDVTHIGEYAFYYCKQINSVSLPNNLVSIGNDAFYQCESLVLPSLPASLENIGDWAFGYCKGSSIAIPASVKSIGNGAFGACKELNSITVDTSNNIYVSPNGCNAIIEKATNRLITGCKTTTIPNTVECIGKSAFSSIENLTSISIPNSVSIIDSLAFNNTGLTSIEIPSSVRSIAYCAFRYCDNLKSITSKILTPFGIPDNVFEHRTGKENPYESAILYVPVGSKTLYLSAEGWKKFANIVEKDDVTETDCAGVIAGTDGTIYRVTGTCTSIANTTYGNWYLMDTSGQIYIYGTLDKDGNTHNFMSLGIEEGDIVTVEGPRQNYNGTVELKDVTVINIVKTKATYVAYGVEYELNKSDKTAKVVSITKGNDDNTVIPSHISYNDDNYNVTTIGPSIFINKNNEIPSITFPATITSVADNAFEGYATSAIVWQSNTPLPANAFKGNEYQNTNFLLFVNRNGIAPTGVKNVVVNGSADEITLIDGEKFCCPQEFTARKISYTHNYRMLTGLNESAGWETIVLPFDVTTIKHETNSDLTPFATWQGESDKKPFWLYSLGINGFVKASSIKANTPYIISMPNNSQYTASYNIPGGVTFSATNAKVYCTDNEYLNIPSYDGALFVPVYHSFMATNLFYLNVINDYSAYSGSEKPGSVFLNSLREANPFECVIYKVSNARSLQIVFGDNENDQSTAIQDILVNEDNQMTVYNLSGQMIGTFNKNELPRTKMRLPAGIYVVNGKKMVIK